ncbi:tetratricopeptide repeat protein [Acidobacteriota bacterium]
MLELNPNQPFSYLIIGICYMQKGQFQDSIIALKKSVELSGNSTEFLSNLALGYAASGDSEKAKELLERLEKLSEQKYVSSLKIAMVYTALGEKDKAFNYLELAFVERDGDLGFIIVDPVFDALRSDSKYEAILKKIGLD